MYTTVTKMKTSSTLALWIHVWMISAEGIKPNDETASVYSLPLYNLEQNKNFSMNNYKMNAFSIITPGVLKTPPRGDTDGKHLNKHYNTQE